MILTGKQKREFRAAGNQLKATVTIGREGVSSRLIRFIDEAFNNKALVKVKILDTCDEDRKMIAARLEKLENTDVVQVLGKTILLYRPLPEED
ncbi:MAG: YhbY family RNA-binding protein [Calditrichales bacterium]|nr:MAG: YhbY family RNA-binding protein [Calditrichales bacterium]